MRWTHVACGLAASLSFTLACGDKAPIYPPLPDSATGADTTGATSSGGSGNTVTGGKTSTGTGGKTSNAGSSSTGGKTNHGGSSGSGNMTGDHCDSPWSGDDPPAPTVACDLDNLADGGVLTGDLMTKTLESGKVYTLKGVTRVLSGQTLTIPPCVVIKGQDRNAVLVLLSGDIGDPANLCAFDSGTPGPSAKLVAVGEPMAPIIFTSSKPVGQRAPGDWGGVLLLGNAHNNLATAHVRQQIEGLERTECEGWYNTNYDDDSSGSLAYVRVEYASRQTGVGLETNGLTFGAVGSGTTVHHVMVSNSGDDCFEFFGGSVNVDHLIALNCDDDMFDSDNGYSGHGQFLFGRQSPNTTEADSRGFEIDSSSQTPATTGAWSNFTVCGGGPEDTHTLGFLRAGLTFRTQAAGSLLNGVITGFTGGGISVQTASTTTLQYSTVFDNAQLFGNAHIGGLDWFSKQMGNSAEAPLGFCNCWADPPVAVAAEKIEGTPPTGFGDESADYQGAFADDSPDSNWMKGLWVDWSSQ
jgi:hypothetical protein